MGSEIALQQFGLLYPDAGRLTQGIDPAKQICLPADAGTGQMGLVITTQHTEAAPPELRRQGELGNGGAA
nr:hypothetical protein [Aeromonas allosaccharophila]